MNTEETTNPIYSRPECPFNYCDSNPACTGRCRHASEETTIKPGAQFKYLGGVFTVGGMYPDIDTLYLKDQNENIYKGRISTFKTMFRNGQYEICGELQRVHIPKNPPVRTSNGVDKVKVNGEWVAMQHCERVDGEWQLRVVIGGEETCQTSCATSCRGFKECKVDNMVKGLGVPKGSAEHRSEAKPECGPAQSATPKESKFNPMNQETKQLTAAQHLEEVRIYGRRLSEFLLPDQVKFLEEAMKSYGQAAIEEQLDELENSAKTEYERDFITNCTRIELK